MADIATIGLRVDSKGVVTATKDLKRLETQGSKAGTMARKLGAAFGALVVAYGGMRIVRGIIANTIEQERVTAQLEQTLKSTGRYTPELSKNLQDYAAELQKVTAFGDEAIIGAQAQLLTFGQLGGEVFPRATEAVLDLATKMGGDLRGATVQIGKALQDPIKGVTALSRSGTTFTEAQQKMIKELVESNRVLDAQKIILDELEVQYGGSARAARDTLGGAISSLKNAFGDLLEGDAGGDGVRGAIDALEELTALLQSAEVKQAFGELTNAVFKTLTVVTKLTVGFANLGNTIGEGIARTIHGPIAGSLDQLDTDIDAIEQRLKLLDREIDGGGIFGMFPFRSDKGMLAEYDGLLAEWNVLVAKRDELIERMDAQDSEAVKKADLSGLKTVPTTIKAGSGGGYTKLQKEIDGARQSLTRMNNELRQSSATFGMAEPDVLAYRLTIGDLSDDVRLLGNEGKALAESIVMQAAAFEDKKNAEALRQEYRALTISLVDQREQLHLNERQLFIYQAQARLSADATRDMRDAVDDLAGKLFDEGKEAEKANRLTEDGIELKLQLRNETEVLNDAVAAYLQLLQGGYIDQETFNRAVAQAREEFEALQDKVEEVESEMSEFMRQAARNMQDAMADGFFSIMQGNLSDLEGNFKRTIDRMVANLLASQLNEFLLGGFASGGSFGGLLGGLFGGGRFGGGSVKGGQIYEVGEQNKPELLQSGNKQYLIPGNNGKIESNQSMSAGGVTVNVNIAGVRDEGSLRQTASQIASRTASAAQRAVSRNN